MAASGIAEHNEARRREMSMQRMAYRKKQLQSQLHDHYGDNPNLGGMSSDRIVDPNADTYQQEVHEIRKVGSPPGISGNFRHDPAYIDQQRRDQLRQQQLVEYSAKIPNRFTSINYAAQW